MRKSVRFEVFKRDAFTCQYCGRKAPDVVLHVDHIEPLARGGADHIMNLVTACAECNAGKSDRPLSDVSAVEKARSQAEQIQERRQQIEMMSEWYASLADIESCAAEGVERLWWRAIGLSGRTLTDGLRVELRRWIVRYGHELVCRAALAAAGKLMASADARDDYEEANAFSSIGRICGVMKAAADDPGIEKLFYVRGILRNRMTIYNERGCIAFLKEARQNGVCPDWMVALAKEVKSWTQFRMAVEQELDAIWDSREEDATDGTHP